MKLFYGILIGLLILSSCSNDDDTNISINETDIDLVTGINIRNSEFSEVIQLGNPNVFSNNQFIAYPNPPAGVLSLSSSQNISDVWIRPANANRIHQETDFNSILNSDLYVETQIQSNSELEFSNLSFLNLDLNLESLNSGYYKVFTKINGEIYWENIFVAENNFEIEYLINYWN